MKMLLITIVLLTSMLFAGEKFETLSCKAKSVTLHGKTKEITQRQVKAKKMYLSLKYNDYNMKISEGILYSTWVETGIYDKTSNGLDYYGFKEQSIYMKDDQPKLNKANHFSLVLNPKTKTIFAMLPSEEGIMQITFTCETKPLWTFDSP